MLPTLNFFGNHTLDFENNNIDELKYYVITELRNIPIPDEVFLAAYDSIMKQFQGGDISNITDIENWVPIGLPDIPGISDEMKKRIVAVGPMCLHLIITPHHIKLPAVVYERIDWYSPQNKEIVKTLRSYYYSIISRFGGDHALYVDERITKKYYEDMPLEDRSALIAFEQALIARYGIIKKPIFSYSHGKYPKYYIDTFEDLLLTK
jgi:hypothetical protein